MPKRSAFLLCTVVLVSVARVAAESAPPPVQPTADASVTKTTDVAATAAPAKSHWDITATLRGSTGWRENVTVSAFHPINRGFWRGEAELLALRPLGSHAEFLTFLNADWLRYFSPPPNVPGEQQQIGYVEGRWHPTDALRSSLKGVGFAETTFIDPSQTEGAQQAPVRVRARGGYATFTQRFNLPWGFALEPSLQEKRIRYVGYNGHYTESRPGLRLEWKRSDLLVLSATAYEHVRHYAELAAAAFPKPNRYNPLLSLHQREGELRVSSTFKVHGEWTLAAAIGRFENRDRAEGYYDYNQNRGTLSVDWQLSGWRVALSGEAKRLDYLTQKVGFGPDALRPARVADAYDTTARLERDLTSRWTIFVEDRWERNRSNAADDIRPDVRPFNYRTNTASIGVQRTF